MSELHVQGLAELHKVLQELPAKIEANILRGALRAGSNVFKEAARDQVPVAPPNDKNARLYNGRMGLLRDSIRVSVRFRKGRMQASIKAGSKDAYYASWVEFGTAAHRIKPKNRRALWLAGKSWELINHPGARPKPFMRRTFDGKNRAALDAFADYIRIRLPKEIAKAHR